MCMQALNWAWQVRGITGTCKLVLLALSDHADARGVAWPGMESLSKKCCLSERAIRNAVYDLQDAGLISITVKGRRNEYLLTAAATKYRHDLPVNAAPDAGIEPNQYRQDVPPTPAPYAAHTGTSFRSTRHDVPPNLKEPSTNHQGTITLCAPAGDDGFERFWKLYRRKVAKGAARKAWAKAIRKAAANQIIAAVSVFPWPIEERFIPHPATWLNDERWADQCPRSHDEQLYAAAGIGPRSLASAPPGVLVIDASPIT